MRNATDEAVVTEIRRREVAEINDSAADREELQRRHGDVWDINELSRDFSVRGYMAPYVVVVRRSDNDVGSLQFQHSPRFHFNWREDSPRSCDNWKDGS